MFQIQVGNILLALLLAILSAVSAQQLTFNRTSVTFDDALGTGNQQSVSMMLATQPAASVFVQISAGNGFIVTPCTLQFDTTNWNVMQQLTVIAPAQANSTANTLVSNLTFDMQTPNLVNRTCTTSQQLLPIFYNVAATKSCSLVSNALTSFDGEVAAFQPPSFASYYMVNSQNLAIEVRQFQCDPVANVYCVEAVGVQYFDAFASLSVSFNGTNNSTIVNGTTAIVSNPTDELIIVEQIGNGITDVIVVRLSDGSVITISQQMTAAGSMYLDVTVNSIGAYRGQVVGLCGNFDGIAMSNAQFAASLQVNVPTVPVTEDVFTCGSCGGLPNTVQQFPCLPDIAPLGFCQVLSPITTTTTPTTTLPTANVTVTTSNITATTTSNITTTALNPNGTVTVTLPVITTTLLVPTLTTTTITVTTVITTNGIVYPTTYVTTVVYPTAYLYPTVYPAPPKPQPPCSSAVPQPTKPITCRPRPAAPTQAAPKDPHVQNGITSTDKVPEQQVRDTNKTTSGSLSAGLDRVSVAAATISAVFMGLMMI